MLRIITSRNYNCEKVEGKEEWHLGASGFEEEEGEEIERGKGERKGERKCYWVVGMK